MPYCPKCDMEFVEGVTKCTDCGGPLFESKEAAMEMMKKAQAKYAEQMQKQYEMMMAQQKQAEEEAQKAAPQAQRQPQKTHAFVDKGEKYEDMNSSAVAFFILGGVTAAVLVLSFAGVISLPFVGVMKWIVTGMLLFMSVGSFMVAISSKKSAATLKTQISTEKDQTKEIIDWFLEKYEPGDIDRRIMFEESNLGPEELSLRRFEWIQDLLITGKDLQDQSYVDMLCDEIYSKLFESK